jgi:hypothetical protein
MLRHDPVYPCAFVTFKPRLETAAGSVFKTSDQPLDPRKALQHAQSLGRGLQLMLLGKSWNVNELYVGVFAMVTPHLILKR